MDNQTEKRDTTVGGGAGTNRDVVGALSNPLPKEPMTEPQVVNNPAAEVSADKLHLSGQVAEVTAQSVEVTQGGVGQIKSHTTTVTVKQGGVGAVVAQEATVEVTEGGIGAVIGREINVRNSNVSVALAGRISGDAKIMIDLRAGFVAGIAIGVVLSAFQMLMKRHR
jgi:hypothetical protein